MESDCEYETDPNDPSDEESQELHDHLNDLTISQDSQKQDGEWLPDHPWQNLKPDPNLKMKDTVTV